MQNTMPMPNMHSTNLLDSIKPMMLTMMMVNQSKESSSSGNSIWSMLWSFLALNFIEMIVSNLKYLFPFIVGYVKTKIGKQLDNKLQIIGATTNNEKMQIKSVITIKLDLSDNVKNPISHAIMDLITNNATTKSILFINNNYTLNYDEPIQINSDIYIQQKTSNNKDDTREEVKDVKDVKERDVKERDAKSTITTTTTDNLFVDIYSYEFDMIQMREALDKIVHTYLIKIRNKLGNQIYYFNEMITNHPRLSTGEIDYNKLPGVLHFTMKPFYTNRQFINLFGEESKKIQKRVEFFRDNKKWYDNKGIPYTLGILMSGQAGAGKTSTIKCLANELKRHIINIQLTPNMTKTQLENLFFDEILNVTQNGKTEQFSIPINQRLYVFEDVDCQCDIVIERSLLNREQEKMREINDLKEYIEHLKAIIENPNKMHQASQKNNVPLNSNVNNNPNKITLSFLLNLLDGVLETPGRIIIMTSNWLNKLDHALIRPGRFDIISKFTKCKHQMLVDMLNHYYEHSLDEMQTQRILSLADEQISPAECSKILFENFGNLEGAICAFEKYFCGLNLNADLENQILVEIGENEVKETNKIQSEEPAEEIKNIENNYWDKVKKDNEFEAVMESMQQTIQEINKKPEKNKTVFLSKTEYANYLASDNNSACTYNDILPFDGDKFGNFEEF